MLFATALVGTGLRWAVLLRDQSSGWSRLWGLRRGGIRSLSIKPQLFRILCAFFAELRGVDRAGGDGIDSVKRSMVRL